MSDWTKSDHCNECGGSGFVWLKHENPAADNEKEQCAECEDLAEQERRADIYEDIAKGD